jgi:hypothetical protein
MKRQKENAKNWSDYYLYNWTQFFFLKKGSANILHFFIGKFELVTTMLRPRVRGKGQDRLKASRKSARVGLELIFCLEPCLEALNSCSTLLNEK